VDATAQCIENLGCDTVQVMDRFGDQLAALPALTAAAIATTALRGRVASPLWRRPLSVVLAKELTTIDVRSEGGVGSASASAGLSHHHVA
jgi:alkanesulfonate monooxygenase SsuD/methylene tetrahydromethanopterin reductase-like flavin-dependent oxidoreductase (luciferase family)